MSNLNYHAGKKQARGKKTANSFESSTAQHQQYIQCSICIYKKITLLSHPKEEKQVLYEPRRLPVASKKEVKTLKKKQATKGSKQAFLLHEENPQLYCALNSFLKVNHLLSNCPLICGWDFRVSTKIEGKKNSYLVQVVASVLLFLSLFLSLVPFEETNLSPSLRNEGMVPVWRSQTQCTSVYFEQNPGTAQAPLRIRFAFCVCALTMAACFGLSHLDTCTVEKQHLGSHCLYAAHDLLLVANQWDPQAHHIPGRQDSTSVRGQLMDSRTPTLH